MARLSKAQHFDVYDDSRPSTSGSLSPRSRSQRDRPAVHRQDSKYEPVKSSGVSGQVLDKYNQKIDHVNGNEDADFLTVHEDDVDDDEDEDEDTDADADADADADDERRESAMTGTSISTMPDSVIHTDHELPFGLHHRPYTPPSSIRPPFRRAESIRRMQMTSPTPHLDRSPRRSILARSSRPGTPRSARSARSHLKSPRSARANQQHFAEGPEPRHGARGAAEEAVDDNDDDERREYPLVLLHLTLLPVELPWSAENMASLLPARTRDALARLRAKVSDTILARGILIPHPREDYELLEERLLEALELRPERLTKCGHFRGTGARGGSMATVSSRGESDGGVDSGHGSSLDEAGSDCDGVCDTCDLRVKTSASGVGPPERRWMVKVFAANGLMRAAAWAAAWPEMERVDVEILPWIGDELRRALDARALEEKAEARRCAEEAENAFVRAPVGELTWLADEGMAEIADREERRVSHMTEAAFAADVLSRMVSATATATATGHIATTLATDADLEHDKAAKNHPDLPPIYRPSEIPLSLLLRNYLFLLAQDPRNVAIFALTIVALWLSIQSAFASHPPATSAPTLELCPLPEASKPMFGTPANIISPAGSAAMNESDFEFLNASNGGDAAASEI